MKPSAKGTSSLWLEWMTHISLDGTPGTQQNCPLPGLKPRLSLEQKLNAVRGRTAKACATQRITKLVCLTLLTVISWYCTVITTSVLITLAKFYNVLIFFLILDPCEYKDVSHLYPDVVQELKERLNYYRSTALPVVYPMIDPKADPKHFNSFWGPWATLEDKSEYFSAKTACNHVQAEQVQRGLHLMQYSNQTLWFHAVLNWDLTVRKKLYTFTIPKIKQKVESRHWNTKTYNNLFVVNASDTVDMWTEISANVRHFL